MCQNYVSFFNGLLLVSLGLWKNNFHMDCVSRYELLEIMIDILVCFIFGSYLLCSVCFSFGKKTHPPHSTNACSFQLPTLLFGLVHFILILQPYLNPVLIWIRCFICRLQLSTLWPSVEHLDAPLLPPHTLHPCHSSSVWACSAHSSRVLPPRASDLLQPRAHCSNVVLGLLLTAILGLDPLFPGASVFPFLGSFSYFPGVFSFIIS